MKEWREYMSESDGAWLLLSDTADPEKPEDLLSTNGQEAVMAGSSKPGNLISFSLVSASREIHPTTGELGYDKDFYIQLYCMRDGWSAISQKAYKIEDALKLAKRFVGLTKEQAIKVWNMRKLGSEGNRVDLQ